MLLDAQTLLKMLVWFTAGVALTVLIGQFLLPLLRRLHVGQTIRAEGPQKHLAKAGTPTMGGLIFIFAMLVLFFCRFEGAPYRWIWLFSFLSFALIGFLDDMYKVVLHRNLGLTGKQKLLGQFVAAALLLAGNAFLCGRGTAIYLPSLLFDGRLTPWFDLGWAYYPVVAIFIVGVVNAVNLTDGLDGLASGVSVPVLFGFMLAALAMRGVFGISGDLALLAAAMAGCCLGFLYYNHYPARVFMGDTGSMALGGAVVGFMLVMRLEIALLGFGLVYLLEAASVMLQVASFKLTGRRVFLMAPLHHHFELKGWPETKVTAMFVLASAGFVFVTLVASALL